jgi:hypothetical protein
MQDRPRYRSRQPNRPTAGEKPGGAGDRRRVPGCLAMFVGPIVGGAVAYYANRDSQLDPPELLTWVTIGGAVVGFVIGCFVWARERRRKQAQMRDASPEPPRRPTPRY